MTTPVVPPGQKISCCVTAWNRSGSGILSVALAVHWLASVTVTMRARPATLLIVAVAPVPVTGVKNELFGSVHDQEYSGVPPEMLALALPLQSATAPTASRPR